MATEQLNVLKALDVAKTQLYHFKAVVIAGMGFFTDAYDLFCIALVTKLLGRIYYTDPALNEPGHLPANVSAAENGVALCGTLAGQLFFGWLGDKLGRKSVYGFTLILMFMKRHGVHLLATTSTWFLLDVAFYSQNLFQKDIFTKIGWIPPAKTMNALEELYRIARAQALIALCGTVPGYWFTVAFIDIIGRFWIQLMGFTMMTIFMLAIAIPYDYLVKPGHHTGFVVLYGLTFFFANFGPNSTTFIVPAEIFPARLRSTCHGISAATGKAGAIIGAFGFLYASQDQKKPETGYSRGIGMRNALFVLAGTNFLGLLFSLLVPESKGKSLEELSKENVGDDDTIAPTGV
uniref:H(+)/Pi cotransporter n=1 Tax=Aegilops tauschii TaxID=37682 RepID=R7W550_AEGTA